MVGDVVGGDRSWLKQAPDVLKSESAWCTLATRHALVIVQPIAVATYLTSIFRLAAFQL